MVKVQNNKVAVSVAMVFCLVFVGGLVFWLLAEGEAVKKARPQETLKALSLPFEAEEILAHYSPTEATSTANSNSENSTNNSDENYEIPTPLQKPYSVTIVLSDRYQSGTPSGKTSFKIVGTDWLYIYVRWVGLSGYHLHTVNLYDPAGHLYMSLKASFHCSEKWQSFQGNKTSMTVGTQGGKSYCWVRVQTPFGAGTWAEKMPGVWKVQAHLDNTGTVQKEASFTLSR